MKRCVGVKCVCVRCGRSTEWDERFGDEVLCVECWDVEVSVVTKAERAALYREDHRAELREYDRRYRASHKDRVRVYREAHRVELNAYRCRYYEANFEFAEGRREYARDYYMRNRGRILECRRERRCLNVRLV